MLIFPCAVHNLHAVFINIINMLSSYAYASQLIIIFKALADGANNI